MTSPSPAFGTLPEVTNAFTLFAMLDARESAAGAGVADAEAARARARSTERDTTGLIDDVEAAGASADIVDCLITLYQAERASREAVAKVVHAAYEMQRQVLFSLWAARKHVQLAEQGAAGPFYTRATGGVSPREAVDAIREIGEGVRWLNDSEGDPAWRPSEQTPQLAAQLAADDEAEAEGMHGDDRQTCGTHRSWLTDCITDPSHSNPVLRYNWCTTHGRPVQICRCWPATVDGRPPQQQGSPDDESIGSDAATWSAADVTAEEEPLPQKGRRPRATYMDWRRSQLVNLGATARDEWYWQCPTTGCKVWAGPYSDPIAAKRVGFEHVYKCEKTDYFRRGRKP